MIGHRLMGASLLHTGRPTQSLAHFEHAVALYNPAEHRALTTRFGVDARVSVLSYRSWALWMLGYPQIALADADRALKEAQEIGHVPTLMFALTHRSITCILCGNYAAAHALLDQIVPLANEKGALFWRDGSIMLQGYVLSLTGKASDGVKKIISGSDACRSTGATMWLPFWMSRLAGVYGELGEFDEAWLRIHEAMTTTETTKERWCESEVYRVAGELAMGPRDRDAAKAEAYFERALAVARAQQAKSWELRSAMSLARLWSDQGKTQQARELLAPVYGWFTEGFDTLDLMEAKKLLDELASVA